MLTKFTDELTVSQWWGIASEQKTGMDYDGFKDAFDLLMTTMTCMLLAEMIWQLCELRTGFVLPDR